MCNVDNSLNESSLPSATTSRLILWLATGHFVGDLVILWLLSGLWSHNQSLVVQLGFPTLIRSQAVLLGIWGSLGTKGRILRIVSVAFGLIFLCGIWHWLVFWVRAELQVTIMINNVLSQTFCTGVMLMMLRYDYARLSRAGDKEVFAVRKKLQFSILHLMLVTLAVALSIPVAEAIRRRLEFDEWEVIMVVCECLVAVQIVVAVFGKHPFIFCSLSFVIATLIGLGIDGFICRWQLFPEITLAALFHCGVVVASLWLVRNCGYRLVWRREGNIC